MPRPLVLVAACLVAALAAGISGSVALTVVSLASGGLAPGADIVSGLIVFTIILCLYGLVAAVVLGLPTHAMLTRFRQTGAVHYAAGGAVAGALLGALFTIPADGNPIALEDLLMLGAGLVSGAVGASAFWLVARPDRRA